MRLVRVMALAAAFVALGADGGISASKPPGNVVLQREKGKAEKAYPAAMFPHWVHAIRYRCYVCHPAIFQMTKFKVRHGILKQDRQPFVKPAEDAKEEGKKKKAKSNGQDLEGGKRMHGPEACGMCHKGEPAFVVDFRTCARCHVP